MPKVDPIQLARAIEAWLSARHGEKNAVKAHWLPLLGISEATFHREVHRSGRQEDRKTRTDRGRRLHPEREDWVRRIIRIKNRPPQGVRGLCTEDALRWALRFGPEHGGVPEEAASMSLGYINSLARQLGLTPAAQRENRFEAERPNQVHQFDASGSEHLYPVRRLGDEWVLKLRRVKMKNKEQPRGLKVWGYGLTDDFSGYRLSRYTVGAGEGAEAGVRFLQWAWAVEPGHAPFRGLPDILYMDNGPLAKAQFFRDFCGQVMVSIETHRPYRAKATGKVENNWKSMWSRFENQFFVDPGWERREISLTELNQELENFWRGWNKRKHRRLSLSREEAWLGIMRLGGPVDIAPEAWGALFHRDERTLDNSGCFDYRGAVYQVQELHAVRVLVYQGVLEDCILVEDPRDHRRYRAEPFEPKPWGKFIGQPKSPLDRLMEEDPREILAERPALFPPGESKVIPLVRAGEVRESTFEMPARPAPVSGPSLEDLAAGVRVVERGNGDGAAEEEIYATPADRYFALRVKQLRGEDLMVEELEFMEAFRAESREYRMLKDALERRARLAAVE